MKADAAIALPARTNLRRWALPIASIGLTLLPFLGLVWLVRRYAVDVPVWDQWELVPLIEKMQTGTLTLGDLWSQHNEHRLFFPRIVMLLLARASGWSIFWELGFILGLAVSLMFVLVVQLRLVARAVNQTQGWWWLLPLLALQVFSVQQVENWLLGYEINIFLNVLFVALGFASLTRRPLRRRDYAWACVCGIVALYSFASGAIYWVIGGLLLVTPGLQERFRWAAVGWWIAIAALVVGTYFVDFHTIGGHPSVLFILEQPLAYGRYLLTFLGAPVASFQQPAAMWAGLVNLGLFPLLAIRAWRHSANVRRALAPFLALGLYSIGTAAVISLGRVGFGVDQAMSSRYVTLAYFLGFANLVLLLVFSHPGLSGARRWRLWALPVAAVLVLSIGYSSWHARLQFADRWAYLTPARAALLTLSNDAIMDRLYPDPARLLERALYLQSQGLSVYRNDGP